MKYKYKYLSKYEIDKLGRDFFLIVAPITTIPMYRMGLEGDPTVPKGHMKYSFCLADVRSCSNRLRIEYHYAGEWDPLEYMSKERYESDYGGDLDTLCRDIARRFDMSCSKIKGMVSYQKFPEPSAWDEIRAIKLYEWLLTGNEPSDLLVGIGKGNVLREFTLLMKGEA